MKKLISLLLIVLLVLLSFWGYNVYKEAFPEYEEFIKIQKGQLPEIENLSSKISQFSYNMRFAKNNLSYSFYDGCSEERIKNMEDAFEIISIRAENLDFYRTGDSLDSADIIISCSKRDEGKSDDSKDRVTFIAGEGGPRKYLELNPYSLIIQGEIQLYTNRYSEKCSEPLVEIHELLHVLGYDHVSDKKSVMYPYLSCDQTFGEEIIESINALYKESPKVELSFRNVSASKAGRYLNFSLEISNSGLIKATNGKLSVYSNDKLVREIEAGEISPGSIYSLAVENLNLPSAKTEEISFKISANEEEYFYDNNIVELYPS